MLQSFKAFESALDYSVGAWKPCNKNIFNIFNMRTKYHVGSFIVQILIPLTALQTHSGPIWLHLFCPLFSFSLPLSTCSSLSLSIHLSTELLCFEAPFLFVSYCLDFPSVAESFPSSLHPSLFPSASFFFSPGAYWCSLITGACRRLLPAALLCEGCARIRCVRVFDWAWVWFFFFCCSVGRENMTNPTLFPALFLIFSCK